MNDQTIRMALTSAIGTLDLAAARLSRAAHGPQRVDIEIVRDDLKTASAELLLLRAKLFDRPTPHELFTPAVNL